MIAILQRVAVLVSLLLVGAVLRAQTAPSVAPLGTDLRSVWHLGRVTGDLERIVQFYHELLGLGLRGERNPNVPFYSVAAINEFVAAPPQAEFRAAFLPIPGASAATVPAEQVYLEAFEYRNIDRVQRVPALFQPGVSSLRFVVRDLDALLARAKAAGVAIVTAGGEPVLVPTPNGLAGTARAIMLQDPDGYPVELLELTPTPSSYSAESSNVLGAHMSVVVADAAVSLQQYRRLIGPDAQVWESTWRTDEGFSRLRNMPVAEHRTATIALPGTTATLDLIEFRGIEQTPHRPVFQDIGIGHVAFLTGDIEAVLERMTELGLRTISRSGTWTQINPTLRALYTRDRDGFFLEVIERP
jgi:catechol 2,3-dioxygenase-like lactoylglutathione lyase family enzyme